MKTCVCEYCGCQIAFDEIDGAFMYLDDDMVGYCEENPMGEPDTTECIECYDASIGIAWNCY